MIIDALILVLIFFGVWHGFHRGFLITLLQIIGTIVGFAIAYTYYNPVADVLSGYITTPHTITLLIAFGLLLFLVSSTWSVIGRIITKLTPDIIDKSLFNKVGGLILGGVYTLIYIAIICWFVSNIPFIKNDARITDSRLVPELTDLVNKPLKQFVSKIATTINENDGTYINPELQSQVSTLALTATDQTIDQVGEKQLFDLVNKERESRGLSKLQYSDALSEVGRKHAADMWNRHYFSHENPDGKSPFDRLSDAGISYIVAGENLALAPTVERAHAGLMASPGHRENILYPQFKTIGIGAIDGGPIQGTMYVQLFMN